MMAFTAPLTMAMTFAAADMAAGASDPMQITDVTVYSDHALVTRSGSASCHAGVARVTVADLPTSVDPTSIHADTAKGHVTSLRWMQAPLPASDIEERLRQAATRLGKARRSLERAAEAGERTDGYDKLVAGWASHSLWRGGASPEVWAGAAEGMLEEHLSVERERSAAEANVEMLTEDEANLRVEREAHEKRAQGTISAEVTVACAPGAAATRVTVRYLARGASWRPTYEVRADPRTATIELTYQAAVRQSTGEAWNDVHLVLSTAVPSDATPPDLFPGIVTSRPRTVPRVLRSMGAEIERVPDAPGVEKAEGRYPGGAGEIFVDLPVPGTVRVASHGDEVRLRVAHHRQEARLRLRAIPRLAASAFWVADLVNPNSFPMLPGPIAVFRGGTFVGVQPLAVAVARRASLLVSFGGEEAVDVGRIPLREAEHKAGLLRRDTRHEFAYRFTLESRLPDVHEVEVIDHIPVSEIQSVKVALDAATTARYRFDARDGLVTWRVGLKRGEGRTLDLAYSVEVPHGLAE